MPKILPTRSPEPQAAQADLQAANDGVGTPTPPEGEHAGERTSGVINAVAMFIRRYVALSAADACAIAAWVAAAWLIGEFDRFPHLCLSSPLKRCGKTTLLELLALIVPRPRPTTNISPAAVYRVIASERPTLLMDEAQSLVRRGSEASEVIREILNAGISKHARVTRCVGKRWEQVGEFPVYSPKVFAHIGEPDGVLGDRCISIELRRKGAGDVVERACSRAVEPQGADLKTALESWATANASAVKECYHSLEPFDIGNDRMAELLLPLQAVLTVAGEHEMLGLLLEHAKATDE